MDPLQVAWLQAFRYGRKSGLPIETAEDFAQYVALTRHAGDHEASLGLLICRFNARGQRGLDNTRPARPQLPKGESNG